MEGFYEVNVKQNMKVINIINISASNVLYKVYL